MAWRHAAGGCLALLLLAQGTALADPSAELHGESQTTDVPGQSPDAAPLPWAELQSRDLEQPLRGGEYSQIMALLRAELEENWVVRSHAITTACNALGSDMAYLRGRVPRQIEDAYRQMAPFQTKALSEPFPAPAPQHATPLSLRIIFPPVDDIEAAALLELIRAGDDYTYIEYEQLLRHFVDLDLAAYLDPAQDDVPLSRAEFLIYLEALHRELQDPTGRLGQYEEFLYEADRLIQELLTMLQEVRRSLALLEATQANSGGISTPVGWAPPTVKGNLTQTSSREAIAPQSPQQIAQFIWLPEIAIAADAPVTRRDFLLAMLDLIQDLMASLGPAFDSPPFRPLNQCGGYRVGSLVNPAEEMQWEVWQMMQALDSLNLEILALVRDQDR